MALGGGPPRETGEAMAGTMVDLHASERPVGSPDQTVFREGWRAGWRDWLWVGVVVVLVALVIVILLTLP